METARPALVGKKESRKNGAADEEKLRRQLGGRIVALREAQGMSQIRLAKLLGIGRSRLSKWECGQHQPLLQHLHALARILGVSLQELLTGGTAKPGSRLEASTRHALAGMVVTLNRLLQSPGDEP